MRQRGRLIRSDQSSLFLSANILRVKVLVLAVCSRTDSPVPIVTLSADTIDMEPVMRRIISGHLLFDEFLGLLAEGSCERHYVLLSVLNGETKTGKEKRDVWGQKKRGKNINCSSSIYWTSDATKYKQAVTLEG